MQDLKLPSPGQRLPSRSFVSNLLITAVSLVLLVWAGRLLQARLTSVVSIDAVISGAIVDVKAPEQGVVTKMTLATGDAVVLEQPLLVLKNDLVSELQFKEINTRLGDRRAELQRAQTQLDQLFLLAQSADTDNQTQYRFENRAAQGAIDEMLSDSQEAKSKLALAQKAHDRAAALQAEGVISQESLDIANAEVEQQRAKFDSTQNRLSTLRANQQAVEQGLTLDRTRSNYDPRIRLQELNMQISDQRQVVQSLQQGIADTGTELAQARQDAERKQEIPIKAATAGVIWSLSVRPGTYVQRGESLGQLLDCSNRWVDAIVDEGMLRSLQIGTPAAIELYGDTAQSLQGKISMIRPGLGRLTTPGGDVALPMPANTPRKAQVRVMIAPNNEPESQRRLCYVGHTAKVTFDIRK